MIVVIRPYSI